MSIFKALAVICSLLSLFVQGAAYAAAVPQAEMIQTIDCAEMASHDTSQPEARNAQDTGKLCDNMTLACLVEMGCIAPLFPFRGFCDQSRTACCRRNISGGIYRQA